MPFWTYMLHCNGGRIYVGQTSNIERRIWEHEGGFVPGFTKDFAPVKLIWTGEFETRDEARAMEARLKGWSKAKKLALVRGDWAEISRLAGNRQTKEVQAFDRLRQGD